MAISLEVDDLTFVDRCLVPDEDEFIPLPLDASQDLPMHLSRCDAAAMIVAVGNSPDDAAAAVAPPPVLLHDGAPHQRTNTTAHRSTTHNPTDQCTEARWNSIQDKMTTHRSTTHNPTDQCTEARWNSIQDKTHKESTVDAPEFNEHTFSNSLLKLLEQELTTTEAADEDDGFDFALGDNDHEESSRAGTNTNTKTTTMMAPQPSLVQVPPTVVMLPTTTTTATPAPAALSVCPLSLPRPRKQTYQRTTDSSDGSGTSTNTNTTTNRSEARWNSIHDKTHTASTVEDQEFNEHTFSNSLLKLSFEDRNTIMEEIHGVTCLAPHETPELLQTAFRSLDDELNTIAEKPAFTLAQQQTSVVADVPYCYVNTTEFRLRFLRAELFQTKKAAERMVKYLALLYETFGLVALRRPIRFSDLTKVEHEFLRGGDYQLLPYRDRSGRRVACIVTNNRRDVPDSTRLKVLLYLWTVAAEDDESQRKGLVAIIYSGPAITAEGQDIPQFHRSRSTTHATVVSAAPMRMAAAHFCFPDTYMSPIMWVGAKFFYMTMPHLSARCKFHLGQSTEIRYSLMGFGIPIELIPSTDTGNVKRANLKQWIKVRDHLEQQHTRMDGGSRLTNGIGNTSASTSASSTVASSNDDEEYRPWQLTHTSPMIVECPGSNDVLFRRGKSMTYHPGNGCLFHNLLEANIQEFRTASQVRKVAIVNTVIDHIRTEKGGRFLTWDAKNNWWVDIMTIKSSSSNSKNRGKEESTLTIKKQCASAAVLAATQARHDFQRNFPPVLSRSPISAANRGHTTTIERMEQPQMAEIQAKVNHAFRNYKKKLITLEKLQVSKSSSSSVFKPQDGLRRKRPKFCSSNPNPDHPGLGISGGGLGNTINMNTAITNHGCFCFGDDSSFSD